MNHQAFPLKSKPRQGSQIAQPLLNIVWEVSAYTIRQEKQTSIIRIGRERKQICHYLDDMIVY